MKIEIFGDNVMSYEPFAIKAANAYKRATKKTPDAVEIRDRNGYVGFDVYRNNELVATYGLENDRITRGFISGINKLTL